MSLGILGIVGLVLSGGLLGWFGTVRIEPDDGVGLGLVARPDHALNRRNGGCGCHQDSGQQRERHQRRTQSCHEAVLSQVP